MNKIAMLYSRHRECGCSVDAELVSLFVVLWGCPALGTGLVAKVHYLVHMYSTVTCQTGSSANVLNGLTRSSHSQQWASLHT